MRLSPSPVKVRPVGKKPNGRDTLKLERRSSEREAAAGTMTATYTNGTDRYGLTHLDIVDRSEGGIGALTRSPIEPGMLVTLCPKGSGVPWLGTMCVRCEPAKNERELFHIGLAYTRRRAA
jgi:hypothetical protein